MNECSSMISYWHFLVTAILALARSSGYVSVEAVTPAREPAT